MRVVFVCIHNSARSQMAEEILRRLAGDKIDVESAGIEPGELNPVVIEALKEIDIDISGKSTRSVASLIAQGRDYDFAITVCDEASAERCPVFPGSCKRLHWGSKDPSQFEGTFEEKLVQVRVIRDDIKNKIILWLKTFSGK